MSVVHDHLPPQTSGATTGRASGIDPVLAGAPHRIGRVALTVRDLDGVSDFYRRTLGLHLREREPGRIRLGTERATLLELRHDPSAPARSPRAAGLFHTAFLMPGRAELGAWLTSARNGRVAIQGASDHLVSEAIYLADPEGNGIEVYADRPSALWPRQGERIEMATDPLDVPGLLAAGEAHGWNGFPSGGLVGHVHLQVGALDAADALYSGLLGFDIACRYPGASFFGSGGYHHQLAGNIWNSRGAGPRDLAATGLADVEILTRTDRLDALRARLPDGMERTDEEGRLRLRDPWGTSITLTAF